MNHGEGRARPGQLQERGRSPRAPRGAAKAALLSAAIAEFNEKGFDGTNSNEIARRAGYAPQTFYRHFEDKIAIFIAVYAAWADKDLQMLETAATIEEAVTALVQSHMDFRLFRRSLRRLAIEHPLVRRARTLARHKQMGRMVQRFPGLASQSPAMRLAVLLTIERLCDALVEGEFADIEGVASPDHNAAVKKDIVHVLRMVSGADSDRVQSDRGPAEGRYSLVRKKK